MKVTCTPSQHFSNRGPFDAGNVLWASYVVEGPAGRVYFAGDTGYGPHFREIARRLGLPRLALLPIGAFRPRWFMGPVHMAPAEAVQAARDLGAATSRPIHYGTFRLADDGESEPLQGLEQALQASPGVRFEGPRLAKGAMYRPRAERSATSGRRPRRRAEGGRGRDEEACCFLSCAPVTLTSAATPEREGQLLHLR